MVVVLIVLMVVFMMVMVMMVVVRMVVMVMVVVMVTVMMASGTVEGESMMFYVPVIFQPDKSCGWSTGLIDPVNNAYVTFNFSVQRRHLTSRDQSKAEVFGGCCLVLVVVVLVGQAGLTD
jgi:hypothetical protein